MKVLSLRQPWAAAVVHLGKSIENRRWNTFFRGEFLIHAAKGMTADEYEGALDFCKDALGSGHHERIDRILAKAELLRGGIVGKARLVSVIPPCRSGEPSLFFEPCDHTWHMPEQYGFVLADIQPLPFVPCKGSLGFFGVPDDVVLQMERRT